MLLVYTPRQLAVPSTKRLRQTPGPGGKLPEPEGLVDALERGNSHLVHRKHGASVALATGRQIVHSHFPPAAMAAYRWQLAHCALRELWDGNDITAQLEQIYAAEPGLLHSVLPQLNNYLLHSAAHGRVETLLVVPCREPC